MQPQASALGATGVIEFDRWLAANSTNSTAFAVKAVLTAPPAVDGYVNVALTPGSKGIVGTIASKLSKMWDHLLGVECTPKNILSVSFCGVGNANTTGTFKITGVQRARRVSGVLGVTSEERWFPVPLVTGDLILGAKLTGGASSEKFADTITVNTTTGAGARVQAWSADVATALLVDDVATLEIDTTGFEYLLLETRVGTATSLNAFYRGY